MPAEKQSALVGFSIDATVFFFLQPNQISRDVECWHAGRAMTATGVEWGGDISGGLNSLTAHVRAAFKKKTLG